MNADGIGTDGLTNNPAVRCRSRLVSGRHQDRVLDLRPADGNFEIYTMNADGSDQTSITNNPANDGFAGLVSGRHQDRVLK